MILMDNVLYLTLANILEYGKQRENIWGYIIHVIEKKELLFAILMEKR